MSILPEGPNAPILVECLLSMTLLSGVDGTDAVFALVGGTVFEGGQAARVYPWGTCLPGGGAATAPAGLDDLVSALMSAEGVALLKAGASTHPLLS